MSALELNSKVSNNIIRVIPEKLTENFSFFELRTLRELQKRCNTAQLSATHCDALQFEETETHCNKDSFHAITHTRNHYIKQLVRIFGPELIRIHRGLKKPAGFFCGVSREFLKT